MYAAGKNNVFEERTNMDYGCGLNCQPQASFRLGDATQN